MAIDTTNNPIEPNLKNKSDFSKVAFASILIVAVLISIITTWTILSTADRNHNIPVDKESKSGQLSFSVNPPEAPIKDNANIKLEVTKFV